MCPGRFELTGADSSARSAFWLITTSAPPSLFTTTQGENIKGWCMNWLKWVLPLACEVRSSGEKTGMVRSPSPTDAPSQCLLSVSKTWDSTNEKFVSLTIIKHNLKERGLLNILLGSFHVFFLFFFFFTVAWFKPKTPQSDTRAESRIGMSTKHYRWAKHNFYTIIKCMSIVKERLKGERGCMMVCSVYATTVKGCEMKATNRLCR